MFKNRSEAGRLLAEKLGKHRANAVVLAIPRGGLQVGRALADSLEVPLDCLFAKKIPLPFAEEVAIGAVTKNVVVVNEEYAAHMQVTQEYIEKKATQLKREIKKLDADYHGEAKRTSVAGKTVILTDDGVATGETMLAALQEVKKQKAARIILAVPVSAPDTWQKLAKKADEAVCLSLPLGFQAVGQFYEEFPQLTHEEAKKLLF